MPCYTLILLARPDLSPDKLAALFRGLARVVYREHGQFRRVVNRGVRPLAHAIRAGGAAYPEARWVEASFDVAPPALAAVAAAVGVAKGVLQFKTLRGADGAAGGGALASFSPRPRGERQKKFSSAMRYKAELFDPPSLTTHAPGTWDPTPPVAAAAPAVAARAAPAEERQLR